MKLIVFHCKITANQKSHKECIAEINHIQLATNKWKIVEFAQENYACLINRYKMNKSMRKCIERW